MQTKKKYTYECLINQTKTKICLIIDWYFLQK